MDVSAVLFPASVCYNACDILQETEGLAGCVPRLSRNSKELIWQNRNGITMRF